MQNHSKNILLATVLTFTLAGAADAQGARTVRYADGAYTATGEYGSQPSHITVKATLRDGVVTAVTVTTHATVPRSLQLQRAFAAAVPKVVIGKRIDQIKVGKLAGSSHTPDGFNDAIRQIGEKASRG